MERIIPHLSYRSTLVNALSVKRSAMYEPHSHSSSVVRGYARERTSESIELNTDEDIIRFNIGNQSREGAPSKKRKVTAKKADLSRKAKLNELRFYRLKAKKKMNSPNPEVRIRYKLEKVCIDTFCVLVSQILWLVLVMFSAFFSRLCVYIHIHIDVYVFFS